MSAGPEHEYDAEELDFGDDGESLPWLESDDEPHAEGFDAGRLLGIGLLMLAVLGAVVGGVWYFTNRVGSGPEPDGSLIAAPDEPYRTRPADEGGKEFPGTGDTSFAVGEGETREGRLADPSQAPSAAAIDGRGNAPPRGTGVQIGAYSTVEAAEAGWNTLRRQTEALDGASYRIVEGRADIGSVQRLYVAAGSAAEADRLCTALRGDGLDCQVK